MWNFPDDIVHTSFEYRKYYVCALLANASLVPAIDRPRH